MINSWIYQMIKVKSSLLVGLLFVLSTHLFAQDALIKDMDSLANTLEQTESKVLDSNSLGGKKVEAVKGPNWKKIGLPRALDTTKVEKKNKAKAEAVDTLILGDSLALVQKDKVTEALDNSSVEDSGKEKLEQISDLISGDNIFWSLIFLAFGYFVVKVLSFILNALAERSPSYRIAFKGAIPIFKIITWVGIILLIIVVIFRPSITTMLAFSASIGVAVGFASQDILKNIFGGIVILVDRPFVSGDKIEVDKYYGEVVEIGLRSTRIVTPDDSLVSVPNAVMMSGSVSNSNTGELNCQVVAEIYLPNHVNTVEVRSIATEAASVSKYIFLGKPITILFFHEINQGGSYIKMKVKAYVMDTRDEFKFKSDMTELIIKELVKKGIIK